MGTKFHHRLPGREICKSLVSAWSYWSSGCGCEHQRCLSLMKAHGPKSKPYHQISGKNFWNEIAVVFQDWLRSYRINLVKAYFLGQGWYLGDGHSSKPGPSKGCQLDPKGWCETESCKATPSKVLAYWIPCQFFRECISTPQNGNKNDKVAVQLR